MRGVGAVGGLTINEMRPTGYKEHSYFDECKTYHAELDTLRAVSTVPPKTTSFIPSMTDEPARGCMSDFNVSIACARGRRRRLWRCRFGAARRWRRRRRQLKGRGGGRKGRTETQITALSLNGGEWSDPECQIKTRHRVSETCSPHFSRHTGTPARSFHLLHLQSNTQFVVRCFVLLAV